MYTEGAKRILVKDGHLTHFIFALQISSKTMKTFPLEMHDRAEKHIAIRQVASVLARMGVDWAILVGEAWWMRLALGFFMPRKHQRVGKRSPSMGFRVMGDSTIGASNSVDKEAK